MHIEDLDEMDNKILEVIKDNARMPYSEIGARVGLSRVSVKARMDTLEKKGVIQGYKTVINSSAAAPSGFTFVLQLEVWHDWLDDVIKMLNGYKRITKVYTMSGTDKIMAVGHTGSVENIQLMERELYRGEGKSYIKRLTWDFVLENVKEETSN